MERRSTERIDLQLTCFVSTGKVNCAPVCGFTENVSRSGMLMRWTEGVPLPPLRKKLVLDVQLPENSDFGARVMRCDARVVRVSPSDGNAHLVAVRVLSMRFVEPEYRAAGADLASMPVRNIVC